MLIRSTGFRQAAEKWHLGASGVKTPDESNALTSWLKPRPTNLPTYSAAQEMAAVDKGMLRTTHKSSYLFRSLFRACDNPRIFVGRGFSHDITPAKSVRL
jgi:hypothetical protein